MGFPLSGHFEVGHVGDSTMATSCWARVHAKPVTAQEGSSEPGPRRGSRRLSGRRERGASVPSSSGRRACVRSCGVFWWVFGQASYLLFGLWATPGDTGSRWAASWAGRYRGVDVSDERLGELRFPRLEDGGPVVS